MAERALLDFVGEGADQGVRSKRSPVPRTRIARGQVGSDHVGHEAALRFPAEHSADDGIGSEIGKYGEPYFGIRAELARLALDATGTGAETDHAHDGATRG